MKRSNCRAYAFWLLLMLPLLGQAETLSLPHLMQLFTNTDERKASYREQQYMGMLEMPMTSSGTLIFRAPDYLEKRVDNGGGSYRVEAQQLQVEHGGQLRTLTLQSYPALAAFIASFRATLAGDEETLQRYYHIELQGEINDWTLTLIPTQAEMARVVREVRIQGSRDRIKVIETVERGGDYSRMELREEDEN